MPGVGHICFHDNGGKTITDALMKAVSDLEAQNGDASLPDATIKAAQQLRSYVEQLPEMKCYSPFFTPITKERIQALYNALDRFRQC